MKKIFAWILSLALVLSLAGGLAEAPKENVFENLADMEWSFASGAGGWSTDMRISADGSFAGEFHDSEMGETGEGYPDGSLYFASFTGKLSQVEKVDEKTWKISVDTLKLDEVAVKEEIRDNVRYVAADAYGLSEGDTMILYAPGTPVTALSDSMQIWAHVMDQENPPKELETWFLSSEKNDSGFVGYEAPLVGMVNPWVEMTAEELMEKAGVSFGVPEGALNVTYRYDAGEDMAEMQFTMDGTEFCARIQSAALEAGEVKDISGMYYTWENVEPISVAHCPGTLGQAQDGDNQVQLCLWYDLAPGFAYSLSAVGPDLNGLDLVALAEQVFVPMQGDA